MYIYMYIYTCVNIYNSIIICCNSLLVCAVLSLTSIMAV